MTKNEEHAQIQGFESQVQSHLLTPHHDTTYVGLSDIPTIKPLMIKD